MADHRACRSVDDDPDAHMEALAEVLREHTVVDIIAFEVAFHR